MIYSAPFYSILFRVYDITSSHTACLCTLMLVVQLTGDVANCKGSVIWYPKRFSLCVCNSLWLNSKQWWSKLTMIECLLNFSGVCARHTPSETERRQRKTRKTINDSKPQKRLTRSPALSRATANKLDNNTLFLFYRLLLIFVPKAI